MTRQLQTVNTSGNNNNCLVNALATSFIVMFHTDSGLRKKLSGLPFRTLENIYKSIGGHDNNVFGAEESDLDAKLQILKLGKILRKYGASLMMNDVRGDQLNSLELEQALLAAFQDYCRNKENNKIDGDQFDDDTFAKMNFVQEKFKTLYPDGIDGPKKYVDETIKSLYAHGTDEPKRYAEEEFNRLYSDSKLDNNESEKKKQELEDKWLFRKKQDIEDEWFSTKNEKLVKWWRASYVDTEAKGQTESPGGYQLYVMELEKEGVELPPQFACNITRKFGFNLVYDNQESNQIRGKLLYASRKTAGPSVFLHRDGARRHWEAYLSPTQVNNFNNTLINKEARLSKMGPVIRDTTYLDFLTSEQRAKFQDVLANDTSADSEHTKHARAFAACYEINDKNIHPFIEVYQKQILSGEGMLMAVARSLAIQHASKTQSKVYERESKLKRYYRKALGKQHKRKRFITPYSNSFFSERHHRKSKTERYQPKARDTLYHRRVFAKRRHRTFKTVFNKNNPLLLRADDFVEGYCKGACSEDVSRYDLLEFAKQYVRLKEQSKQNEDVKNGKKTPHQIAEETTFEWARQQNKDWRNFVQTEIYKRLQNSPLKDQLKLNGVEIITSLRVSQNEVAYKLKFENGLVLRRAQGKGGQFEVSTTGAAGKNFTREGCYEAIAKVFKLERPGDKQEIVLQSVSLEDNKAIRDAFLKAGFVKVDFIDPAATDEKGSEVDSSEESSEKNTLPVSDDAAADESSESNQTEEPAMPIPSAPPMRM